MRTKRPQSFQAQGLPTHHGLGTRRPRAPLTTTAAQQLEQGEAASSEPLFHSVTSFYIMSQKSSWLPAALRRAGPRSRAFPVVPGFLLSTSLLFSSQHGACLRGPHYGLSLSFQLKHPDTCVSFKNTYIFKLKTMCTDVERQPSVRSTDGA